jgi:hypothetical protein
VDERLDVHKSTRAAAKMLRELILDFGAGSSVMLAWPLTTPARRRSLPPLIIGRDPGQFGFGS